MSGVSIYLLRWGRQWQLTLWAKGQIYECESL